MVYQPKVDGNGGIVGLEALIRWRSPTLGNVPCEFVPVAENSVLIRDITRFVIDEVCAFIRMTIDQGRRCPSIALNLSAIDIVCHDLLEIIDESTTRHATPSDLLEFEIRRNRIDR